MKSPKKKPFRGDSNRPRSRPAEGDSARPHGKSHGKDERRKGPPREGQSRDGQTRDGQSRDGKAPRRRDWQEGGKPPREEHARTHEKKSGGRDEDRTQRLWNYGRHAALAALANPQRKIKRILAAETALDWIAEARLPQERLAMLKTEARREDFDRVLPDSAVHQGLAVEIEELKRARLRETCEPRDSMAPVLVLDQITDPHNIGAIFRSAAAFGVRAIIVQDRRTPPLAGALAKAAAGAIELVPCVEVVNVSRALEALKSMGYHVAGLAGEAGASLADMPRDKPVALVLGAEGEGLRRLVGDTCDALYRIPISRRMESLNVSNAAAVALYELGRTGLEQ